MIRSLRSRLLLGMVAGMTLLLILFSGIMYFVIRDALKKQFDASLAASARLLAAGVEMDLAKENEEPKELQDQKNAVDIEFDLQMMPEFQRKKRPSYFQIWRQDNSVVARSPSVGQTDLLRFEGAPDKPFFLSVRLPNERPGRAVSLRFTPRIEENRKWIPSSSNDYMLTLVVARDASEMLAELRFVRWLLLYASLGVIVISCLVSAWIVRRSLGPLNSLGAAIAAIPEDELSRRIEIKHLPAEIMPIKEKLNNLLARMESSFNRERQFTADVAHELRTPLAGLRTTLEVALSRQRNVQEYHAALANCLAINKNMEITVANLLALARLDARQITFQRVRIELAKWIDSAWNPFQTKAKKRNLAFENQLPENLTCSSDPEFLSLVLSNLLDNAVEYANDNGRIWVTGKPTNDSVEITIANSGCPLGPENLDRIFDRFWRSDAARTQNDAKCGLGLALVHNILKALGGRTRAEIQNGNIFSITLTLPLWKNSR